jgi:PAS domain S-box-containing protein
VLVRQRRRLREVEQREREFRDLVDHAPDVVIRFDRDLRIRFVNPQVEEHTGRTATSLLGRSLRELGFPARNVREWEEGLGRVLASGRPGVMEFSFATPDGARHFESRFVPELDADGATRSIIGITRDVTERRLAEERFRRSEAFLGEAQRISQTGSWSWNRVTGAITWSDEHYRLFAADPAVPRPWPPEALRALFWARVHPADRRGVRSVFQAALRDFTALATDFRVVLPDGSVRFVRSEGAPTHGEDYIGTTMDVTDARRADEVLRRSEGYLAEGQQLTKTGSWRWTRTTGERFWSREMYRIYGFEPADVPPAYEDVLARAHPADAPEVDRALNESFRTGAELRLLTRILVPGQPMKWVQTYGHAVRDEHDAVAEVVGTVVDVTERVRADRRLRRAIKARYEAALAERTRIARDMHDGLLQDLTGIALQIGAVLPQVASTPDAAVLRLRAILEQTEKAAREARHTVGGMRGHAAQVDLVGVVQGTAKRVAAQASLALTLRVAGQACLVGEPLRDAAVAVVHEALTNVVKHAGARRVTISLTFALEHLRITVRDDGRGLQPVRDGGAAVPHFGLVGMHERAGIVGGTLTVSSAPGRGTIVRLDVPLSRRRSEPDA